ncbi:hypothetical protein Jab_2c34530 [Janthinobacterium sp. HH01]|nr:hypothetical protein Jab_2c34530 [Janthinobacterium sp. HH01]
MIIESSNTEPYVESKGSHDFWIVEAIWGHRIERQPYSALMLEFLGMAEGMHRAGALFERTRPGEKHVYEAQRSLQLRNILFKNPNMEEILRDSLEHDDSAWTAWLKDMAENASVGSTLTPDFSYLRARFDSFKELVNVVKLLRNIAIDPGSDRAWTTQFIFPIGPAALYEALFEKKGGGLESTRRVFTRTGELAYLMLSRASEHVRSRLRKGLLPSLDPTESRNKLILRLLSGSKPELGPAKSGTYLPYVEHPAYDRMATDIASILELDLPNQDSFQYIQPLLGLHIYLYAVETANNWMGGVGIPNIVCEILAPRSDLVRKAALASYMDNDGLGLGAVRAYIEKIVLADETLQSALQSTDLDDISRREALLEHLREHCALNKDITLQPSDSATMLKEFCAKAENYYKTYTADGLVGIGTGCGLVSRRGTSRLRYAPTDELLRCLVLANVTTPIEETAFLRLLFDRYRIIIGPLEARGAVPPSIFDETDFKKNRDRFGQHLIGLGLARRMSDACTYVINPMDKRA